VGTVKRMARYMGKPYVALRSSGLTALAAALRKISTERRAVDQLRVQVRAEMGE
jgi:hypothetical protein